ncbi:MAG: hydantoinase/oxoprolinase family protein, partial [Pseudomonadota bacterium]
QVSGPTPSDASHVLGRLENWDKSAAEKAILLLCRKRTGSGDVVSEDAGNMAQMIIDQLTHQTSLALLESAFAEESHDYGIPSAQLASHVLMQKGLSDHRGLVRLSTGLNIPLLGLGASAPSYYPAVGDRLGCETILPEHAGVANAIGAVVGQVTIRRSGTVTAPLEGLFRVHFESGPKDFVEESSALQALQEQLEVEARTAADEAGAQDVRIRVEKDVKKAEIEAQDVFIEARLTVEASGRPRIAS